VKPLLIYDGDCSFCIRWVERWRLITRDRVDYKPYQDVYTAFPQISLQTFKESVQLIDSDEKVYAGAEAVFRTLRYDSRQRGLWWAYERVPGIRQMSEWFYRTVAQNRDRFSDLTQFFWGKWLLPSTYTISTSIFLRLLGAIYLIAIASFWTQMPGLIGTQGILPVTETIAAVKAQLGPNGFLSFPTLAWWMPTESFLHILCGVGVVGSLAVMMQVCSGFSLVVLWLIYLSLQTVSRDFLGFQWDVLLLETGFLAIFLAPWKKPFSKSLQITPASPVTIFLFWWLLFRLMFMSGVAKLASGDPAWHHFTALTYYYETQPLPTWIGWYVHQLPAWFQHTSVVVMFAIELIIPFFIFMPRRIRFFAAFSIAAFQCLIMLTGNYCFFNLLALALCVLLIDDALYLKGERDRILKFQSDNQMTLPVKNRPAHLALAVIIFALSLVPLFDRLDLGRFLPRPLVKAYQFIGSWQIVNSYGLFAVMTTQRPEIIIEGSWDGSHWYPYEFKYKPGELTKKPVFVEPHQPRLDWQMWFAALSGWRRHPWFLSFCKRLLEGSKPVLALLKTNPFPDEPPQYVRARVYLYHFTDFKTRRETKAWWRRNEAGEYLPVISLNA